MVFSDLFLLNIFQTMKCLSSGNIKSRMKILQEQIKLIQLKLKIKVDWKWEAFLFGKVD